MPEAYPLDWPVAFKRTKPLGRVRAKFKSTWAGGLWSVQNELRLMRVTNVIISTNQPIRKDGQPYAAERRIEDPGVAVYFHRKGRPLSIACDRWERIEDNLRAIGLTVEAMRGLDRWGASDMLDRVFQGFTALPPPAGHVEPDPDWWTVLGCSQEWPLDAIEFAYKMRAKQLHPDLGGDAAEMQAMNRAIETARAEKGA